MTPLAPGVMLIQMVHIPSRNGRLGSRVAVGHCVRLASIAGAVLGLLAGLGCGQAGLAEPEVPTHTGHLLELPTSRPVRAEVLRASVELFGIEIASLESTTCGAADSGATFATRVEPAALVKAIRSTGGEARTELSSGAVPASSEYTFRDGELVRHYRVDYRPGSYAYVYDNGGVARRTGTQPIPDGAEPHDMHSSMLLLRAWRPRLDETAYFYVVLGRRPWRVDVTARGPEVIRLGEEPRLTHRIDGVAARLDESTEGAPKRFSLWLSEDAARIPLRMVADASFGSVTMTLTGRDAGERHCVSPAVAERAPLRPRSVRPNMRGPRVRVGLIGSAWSTPRPPPQ